MTHSPIPQLPQELVEEVIDQLADDVKTLKACSAVSRAWISRSRFHLFSNLRVRTNTFTDFTNFLPNSHDHGEQHVIEYGGRVPLTHSILAVVKVLHLKGKAYGLKPLLTVGSLQGILRALPSLQELRLDTVRLDDTDFVPCSKPGITLVALTLVSVDANSASSEGGEFLALLSLFRRIDSLFLRFVHFNKYPATAVDAQEHPALLSVTHPYFPSKLEVCDLRLHLPRHTVFFLELFKRTATHRTLRSLRVTCRTTEKFEAIGSFCKDADIGRSLEKLEVDLKYCIPQNGTDIPLLSTINHLQSLREITLSGLCLALNTVSVEFSIFGIIRPLISSAPASTTKFTVVLLLMEPPEDACHIFESDENDPRTTSQWERLQDAVLTRPSGNLMAIEVVFRSPFFALGVAGESIERIENCIKREMGALASQGLLALRFEEDYNI